MLNGARDLSIAATSDDSMQTEPRPARPTPAPAGPTSPLLPPRPSPSSRPRRRSAPGWTRRSADRSTLWRSRPRTSAPPPSGSGPGAVAGAAIALTIAVHIVTATTLRNITAAGSVTFHAIGFSQTPVTPRPAAAPTSAGGQHPRGPRRPAGARRGPRRSHPPARAAVARDRSPARASRRPPRPSPPPHGLANSIALVPATVSITAGGRLSVLADSQLDSSASADGGGVDSGSAGVAAAVAVNLAIVLVDARIDGGIDASGLSVQAGMVSPTSGGNGSHDLRDGDRRPRARRHRPRGRARPSRSCSRPRQLSAILPADLRSPM